MSRAEAKPAASVLHWLLLVHARCWRGCEAQGEQRGWRLLCRRGLALGRQQWSSTEGARLSRDVRVLCRDGLRKRRVICPSQPPSTQLSASCLHRGGSTEDFWSRDQTVAEHICCLHIWKEVFFCACGVHSSRKTEPGVINPVPYVPFTPKRATVPVSPKLHPPRCRSLVVPVLPSTGAG